MDKKGPVIMGEQFELIARTLWFENVDRQGYPNGLPTWDEICADKEKPGIFADWYAEYLHNALAVAEVIEHHFTLTPKASSPAALASHTVTDRREVLEEALRQLEMIKLIADSGSRRIETAMDACDKILEICSVDLSALPAPVHTGDEASES